MEARSLPRPRGPDWARTDSDRPAADAAAERRGPLLPGAGGAPGLASPAAWRRDSYASIGWAASARRAAAVPLATAANPSGRAVTRRDWLGSDPQRPTWQGRPRRAARPSRLRDPAGGRDRAAAGFSAPRPPPQGPGGSAANSCLAGA